MASSRQPVLREVAPDDLLGGTGLPASVTAWKTLARGLLTEEACTFHRNVEISAWYAWMYRQGTSAFKWAGMAALASHHVKRALAPFRLQSDRHGYVDPTRSAAHHGRLLMDDTDIIRRIGNSIFEDLFWVHLAYVTSGHDLAYLRTLMAARPEYGPVVRGFELLDAGCASHATSVVWQGNLGLLEHEQRAMVQPQFDRLSGTYAQLISMGAATAFEARGLRDRTTFFTSFYLSTLWSSRARLRGPWPTITSFEDRWLWLTASVVPRFQAFEARPGLMDAVVDTILDQDEYFAAHPCVRAASRPALGASTSEASRATQAIDDRLVDLMAEGSFPGSDPPSTWAGR